MLGISGWSTRTAKSLFDACGSDRAMQSQAPQACRQPLHLLARLTMRVLGSELTGASYSMGSIKSWAMLGEPSLHARNRRSTRMLIHCSYSVGCVKSRALVGPPSQHVRNGKVGKGRRLMGC